MYMYMGFQPFLRRVVVVLCCIVLLCLLSRLIMYMYIHVYKYATALCLYSSHNIYIHHDYNMLAANLLLNMYMYGCCTSA